MRLGKLRWLNLTFALAAVAVMVSWGVYSVLWTPPINEATIVQNALERDVNRINLNPRNVTAESEARYTVLFQTKIPATEAPSTILAGENVAFGPVPWGPANTTFFQADREYAVFELEFTLKGQSYTQNPTIWYSSPQGNITAAEFLSTFVGGYSASALEVSSVGNYTLHFLNKPSTNATVKISMGWSPVTYQYSRPYLYQGIATIGLAGTFTIITGYFSSRRIPQAAGTA